MKESLGRIVQSKDAATMKQAALMATRFKVLCRQQAQDLVALKEERRRVAERVREVEAKLQQQGMARGQRDDARQQLREKRAEKALLQTRLAQLGQQQQQHEHAEALSGGGGFSAAASFSSPVKKRSKTAALFVPSPPPGPPPPLMEGMLAPLSPYRRRSTSEGAPAVTGREEEEEEEGSAYEALQGSIDALQARILGKLEGGR